MKAEDVVVETQFFLRDSFFVHGRKLRGDRIVSGGMPNVLILLRRPSQNLHCWQA